MAMSAGPLRQAVLEELRALGFEWQNGEPHLSEEQMNVSESDSVKSRLRNRPTSNSYGFPSLVLGSVWEPSMRSFDSWLVGSRKTSGYIKDLETLNRRSMQHLGSIPL